MAAKVHRPEDCALAIGIPIDKAGFLAGSETGPGYASNYRLANPGVPTEILWHDSYAKLVAYMTRICQEVAAEGVTVVPKARLADITDLVQRFPVLTLVTHCEWPRITSADITQADHLLAAISTGLESVPAALRLVIPGLHQAPKGGPDSPELRGWLAEQLERVAGAAYAWHAAARDFVFSPTDCAGSFPAHYLTRPALELAFPRLIQPGRAVELGSGMETLPDFIAALPRDFAGILDFTLCNSSLLAGGIKLARPHCVVAIGRGPKDLDVAFARYRIIIKTLHKSPAPFGDVCAKVHGWRAEGFGT